MPAQKPHCLHRACPTCKPLSSLLSVVLRHTPMHTCLQMFQPVNSIGTPSVIHLPATKPTLMQFQSQANKLIEFSMLKWSLLTLMQRGGTTSPFSVQNVRDAFLVVHRTTCAFILQCPPIHLLQSRHIK